MLNHIYTFFPFPVTQKPCDLNFLRFFPLFPLFLFAPLPFLLFLGSLSLGMDFMQ